MTSLTYLRVGGNRVRRTYERLRYNLPPGQVIVARTPSRVVSTDGVVWLARFR